MQASGRNGIQAGLWWIAASGILMATAAWTGASEFGPPLLDCEALVLANAWRSHWLDAIFMSSTWMGSLAVLLPLVTISGILLWRRGHRGEAGFVVASLLGASVLAQVAKHLVQRPRPDLFLALIPVADPFSFPSAHAVQVTAVAVALLLVVIRLVPRYRRWALPVLVLIVVLVGFSRLYLQVHYPSDVLAGTLAAACWAMGLRAVMLPTDTAPQV
jgi:undecaprenyl-diphosphatase